MSHVEIQINSVYVFMYTVFIGNDIISHPWLGYFDIQNKNKEKGLDYLSKTHKQE